jgi:hypothetical protein
MRPVPRIASETAEGLTPASRAISRMEAIRATKRNDQVFSKPIVVPLA